MRTRNKLTLGLLILVVLTLGFWWLLSYHTSELKGGAGISDSGLFTYPRYHIKLGAIPLSEPGEYTFNVSGLPPVPLNLEFYVLETNSGEQLPILTQLHSLLEVNVTDSSGRTLCSASGRLSAAATGNSASWLLKRGSSVAAAFWQSKCLDISINRRASYKIEVRLTDVDPRSPQILLEPTLEGGGIELP
jgi:hypothetical protein